jgi:aspartate racemase
LQHAGEWEALTRLMCDAGRALQRGGADFLVICTNTMHLMADAVEAAAGLPLLHIADPAGAAIAARGLGKVGLLGTAFTMEQDFYRARLAERHGLEVIVPEADDRAVVHRVIYEELVAGKIEASSREAYRAVIERLVERGAEAVVLGCTEIGLLIGEADSAVPLFDTTRLHAEAAVDWALQG